jgi:adenylylsulfate kinase
VAASSNVVWHPASVTARQREALKGHRGAVVWLTGLSGSGKSTVANALDAALHAAGVHAYLLDGDNLRHGLNADLGFTPGDRAENVRRVVEVAKLLTDAGLVVTTALISPYRADREAARARIGAERFLEVFVDTPIELCEARDPKGLYARARAGEIRGFSGIDDPYEAPESPDLRLDGAAEATPAAQAQAILAALRGRGVLPPLP